MPDPNKSPEEQARGAFSVACGTAFLNSKRGQDFIDQQIADMGKYPITPMHTFTRQFEAIQGWDSYDELGQIKAPTLIFHGDDDKLLPHANAEILHPANSRLEGAHSQGHRAHVFLGSAGRIGAHSRRFRRLGKIILEQFGRRNKMANYETITYEKVEDKIFRLTLNRPEKLNALSQKLLGGIRKRDERVRKRSGGERADHSWRGRAFSAGYDLQGTQHPGSKFTVTSDRYGLHKTIERWQRLWNINKPTIAQVHGFCLAGGTELIGHCDIVFASEDAQFGHPAGRSLGILPTLSMWPVLMGPRKTKEYFFTGDYMSAKEALEWHLINRVYPKDKLEEETLAYCAPRRDGSGRAAYATQGRGQSLLRHPRYSRGGAIIGGHRCHRASDRHGEGVDEGEPRERPEGGAERARPSLREEEGVANSIFSEFL